MQDAMAFIPGVTEKRPMGQALHPLASTRPVALLYRPAAQSVHVDMAVVEVTLAYLPASHALDKQLAFPASAW